MEDRRPLTEEERQIAHALKSIWDIKKKALKLNQLDAANEMGFSSQSTVSQYINGKIPLNTDAKIKFAKLLGVNVSDFDPSFSKKSEVIEHNEAIKEIMDDVTDLNDGELASLKGYIAGLKSARDS